MSGNGGTNGNQGAFDMSAWKDQLLTSVYSSIPMEPTIIDQIVNGVPREIFDLIMNELTLDEQAKLASSSAELNRYIRPVMDGFVWTNPPWSLPDMMIGDKDMPWAYVKLAEEAAAATGHVACPWCNTIHSPLRALETPPGREVDYWTYYNRKNRRRQGRRRLAGYMCSRAPRPDNAGVGPYQSIPSSWHPLMLYAFGRWSTLGLNTARLRQAAGLDFFSEELSANLDVPIERHQWNLNWVPGYGLFARARHSQLYIETDNFVTGPDPICICGECALVFDCGRLNKAEFSVEAASITYKRTPPFQAPVISADDWKSGGLYIGRTLGCPRCPLEFQFAWEAFENDRSRELYGECHWMHFTTWFHIGNIDILAKFEMMMNDVADNWLVIPQVDRRELLSDHGEIARLSGLS
ncbi:uncharacterized protein PG998_011767 [Apiospora kogelbergensis]|uniref:uncharacterized protein n=1 Tax=Apiospora kogelbergensis TaxID=1337665 RepID=UPI00312E663D